MRFNHHCDQRPAAGFSVLELLVVCAILGVVVAITTAAVQRVRATAARTTCANQLRQLALALHAHAAAHGSFPPGVGNQNGKDPYPFLSFHGRLLPYLEQQARWDQIEAAFRSTNNFLADPPHAGLSTAMPQFGCPLDDRTRTPQPVRGNVVRGLTSYLGVEGTNSFRQDGVLFLDSRVRPADVSDGLSNTLALGERPASADHLFGWWYGGWGQDKDGEADSVLGSRTKNNQIWVRSCPVGPYSFQRGDLLNQCDAFHFWSLHSGGANFAFADGSVRFLRYAIDPLFVPLSTRAGSDVAALPD
jgi:prepilin-type processing-associated H-X9-DG protein